MNGTLIELTSIPNRQKNLMKLKKQVNYYYPVLTMRPHSKIRGCNCNDNGIEISESNYEHGGRHELVN